MLLAAIGKLTGIDLLIVSQFINTLSLGLIIWFGGKLFLKVFQERIDLAMLASVLIAFSIPILSVASNVSSDPLFLLFVILFLLAAKEFLSAESIQALGLMGLWAVLGSLTRFAGISLLLTGFCLILLSGHDARFRKILKSMGFFIVAGLPLFMWSYFHNYVNGFSLFGHHLPAVPLGNIDITITKIVAWFMPESIWRFVGPWTIVLAIMILFLTGNPKKDWTIWIRGFADPGILPNLLFLAIYSFMLVFYTSYFEARVPGFDRIHVVILPSLLIVLFYSFTVLIPKYLLLLPSIVQRFFYIGLLALIIVFPIYRAQKYVRSAYQKGDTYYNYINTRELRESELIAYIQSAEFPDSGFVYSNNEAIAWFYTRRLIVDLPINDTNYDKIMDEPEIWPNKGDTGMLLWFTGQLDYKPGIVFPEQAVRNGWLTLEFAGDYGDIYLITR
ncbi:MAG: hypothetical protein M1347_01810 [Chloroflexi bacterium]|nr:hypothetical protein [Chloroflexota bacterium]